MIHLYRRIRSLLAPWWSRFKWDADYRRTLRDMSKAQRKKGK